ncbi:MAG: tRNA pseudouridine(38-40) synthase TruA [Parvularcula sp.]
MPRYFLTIEFDGAPFVGWQRQENGPSVQAAIEAAGQAFCGVPIPVYGAGRTDAGVHGLAMVAHIDLPRAYNPSTVVSALNAHLRPHPIAILRAQQVNDDLHARFSCHQRSYLYRLLDRRPPAPLRAGKVWQIPQDLDWQAMHTAGQYLIGKHDFTAFRSAQCQADSPHKTLTTLTVSRIEDEVHCNLSAPSFLHNQVRSIVGTLVQVGLGRWSPKAVHDVLEARDRSRCGPVAPAHGLYFLKAEYVDIGPSDPS